MMVKLPKEKTGSVGIFIVEPQELNRTGFRLIFEMDERLEVVGESDDLESALNEIIQIEPTVLMMKTENRERDAKLVRALKESNPSIQVLVLFESIDLLSMGLFVGAFANGFCTRSINVENLLAAVHAVAAGGMWFGPMAAPALIERLAEPVSPSKQSNHINLTDREKEILKRLVKGSTNQAIAHDLGLSVETVKTYIRRIMDKSSIRSRRELIIVYRNLANKKNSGADDPRNTNPRGFECQN